MPWNFYNSSGELLVQHAESEATQAEMEAETAGVKFVPPDLVKNSPGVAKAWCHIAAAGTLSSPSYNVASVTDTGTGDRTIVWDTDFSSAVYAVVNATAQGLTDNRNFQDYRNFAAGSIQHKTNDAATGAGLDVVDAASSTVAFGDQ